MSGFLNNLVLRSFGLGEVIRSRVPSLFEPQDGAAVPVAPQSYAEASSPKTPASAKPLSETDSPGVRQSGEIAVSQETVPMFSRRQTAADGTDSMREPGPGERITEAYSSLSPAGFKPYPREAEPQALPSAIPMPSVQTALPLVQAQVMRTSFNDDILKFRVETDPFARQSAITRPERAAIMLESGTSANQRAAVFSSADSSRQSRTAEILYPRSSSVRPTHTSIQAAKPSIPSKVTLYQQQNRPSGWQKTESEPTIQVTIGRIEVRAEPPSVRSPAKERSVPQAMSLDDYLRRRTGRSRE